MRVRKQRNKILRDLAMAKNLQFRQSMLGKTLSVVTLEQEKIALSDNYLKVELAAPRAANQLIDVVVDEATSVGLRERNPLRVI